MRATARWLVLAGIGGAFVPSHAIGSPVSIPPLIIRIYDNVGVVSERMATAHHALTAALKPAGIDVIWRDCRMMAAIGDADPSCDRPLAAAEVIIRIVNAGSKQGDELGYSSVDVRRQHVDCLATVLADRVEAMASRTQSDPGTLLGHVMAHEISHLLIGTTEHSAIGLMRNRWSDEEVRNRQAIDWYLTREDAKQVRSGLLERSKRVSQSAAGDGSSRPTAGGVPFGEWTLKPVAATGWRPVALPGRCADASSSSVPPLNPSVSQLLRQSVKLLARYVQLLLTRVRGVPCAVPV